MSYIYSLVMGIIDIQKNYSPSIGYQLEFSHSTLGEEDCDFAL